MSGVRIRLMPTPRYPDIVLALNFIPGRSISVAFHWFIFTCHATDTSKEIQAGRKFHARRVDSPEDTTPQWCYEDAEFTLATSATVATAAVIGRLREGQTEGTLGALLSQIPLTIPQVDVGRESHFTCRVWVREALRAMHRHRYINCPDVDALEKEMWGYGMEAYKNYVESGGDPDDSVLHTKPDHCHPVE